LAGFQVTLIGRFCVTAEVKFLPEELDKDPLALSRFQREAQAASAPNHPNICTSMKSGRKMARHSSQWNTWMA
jgi:hypothetical protein